MGARASAAPSARVLKAASSWSSLQPLVKLKRCKRRCQFNLPGRRCFTTKDLRRDSLFWLRFALFASLLDGPFVETVDEPVHSLLLDDAAETRAVIVHRRDVVHHNVHNAPLAARAAQHVVNVRWLSFNDHLR